MQRASNFVACVNGHHIYQRPGTDKFDLWSKDTGFWGFGLTLAAARSTCEFVAAGNTPPPLEHVASEMAKGFAEAEDTVYCPNCGARKKSAAEAVQEVRDETCVYVCAACSSVCDALPF